MIVTFQATFLRNWPSFSSQFIQYLSEPNSLNLKIEKMYSSKTSLSVCGHIGFQNLGYYNLNTIHSMKIWKPRFRMEIQFNLGLNLQLPLMKVWCEFSWVGFKDVIADVLYRIVVIMTSGIVSAWCSYCSTSCCHLVDKTFTLNIIHFLCNYITLTKFSTNLLHYTIYCWLVLWLPEVGLLS